MFKCGKVTNKCWKWLSHPPKKNLPIPQKFGHPPLHIFTTTPISNLSLHPNTILSPDPQPFLAFNPPPEIFSTLPPKTIYTPTKNYFATSPHKVLVINFIWSGNFKFWLMSRLGVVTLDVNTSFSQDSSTHLNAKQLGPLGLFKQRWAGDRYWNTGAWLI